MTHDCRTCGACCASLAEDRPTLADVLPSDLARMSPRTVRLRVLREHDAHGTKTAWKQQVTGPFAGHKACVCSALRGSLLSRVSCGMYDERPDVCREFEPGSKRCKEVRAAALAISVDLSEDVVR